MTDLKWTKDMPRKPGFYWMSKFPHDDPEIVEIDVYEGRAFRVWLRGNYYPLDDVGLEWVWCGPLTVPEGLK